MWALNGSLSLLCGLYAGRFTPLRITLWERTGDGARVSSFFNRKKDGCAVRLLGTLKHRGPPLGGIGLGSSFEEARPSPFNGGGGGASEKEGSSASAPKMGAEVEL